MDRERGSASRTPIWPAVQVVGAQGSESLFVFSSRSTSPVLLAAWPRGESSDHAVRIFPGYRWILVETPIATDPEAAAVRRQRLFAPSGQLVWETQSTATPTPLGRDLVLWPRLHSERDPGPGVAVLRLPEGTERASWPAVMGWGTSSPLENFVAVNTIGLQDSTGVRQDELRLMDLEGTVVWSKPLTADYRSFGVSNFGDVAIARDQQLIVFDRSGIEKLRVPIPLNTVGRTTITPDGRYVLVATRTPIATKRKSGDLWVALYDTKRGVPVWTRRDLGNARGTDVLELGLSEDGGRALVRLSTGPVMLLGRDGTSIARWNLERAARGEFDPGVVPRRTWMSNDGTLVGFTSPVARTLADARGWLYRVPR